MTNLYKEKPPIGLPVQEMIDFPGRVECKPYVVQQHHGMRVGFIGCCDESWFTGMSKFHRQFKHRDIEPIERFLLGDDGLLCKLRGEERCDLIVLVSHMRHSSDEKVAQLCPEIDLILTGHDHDLKLRCVNGIPILNSGHDFECFSSVNVWKRGNAPKLEFDNTKAINDDDKSTSQVMYRGPRFVFEVTNCEVRETDPVDPEVDAIARDIEEKSECRVASRLVWLHEPLDGSGFRGKEVPMANWMADQLRKHEFISGTSDFALVTGGNMRSNQTFPANGICSEADPYGFTLGDLKTVITFTENSSQLLVSTRTLVDMLNYSLSLCRTAGDGKLLHVSGLRFVFEPRLVGGEPNLHPVYTGDFRTGPVVEVWRTGGEGEELIYERSQNPSKDFNERKWKVAILGEYFADCSWDHRELYHHETSCPAHPRNDAAYATCEGCQNALYPIETAGDGYGAVLIKPFGKVSDLSEEAIRADPSRPMIISFDGDTWRDIVKTELQEIDVWALPTLNAENSRMLMRYTANGELVKKPLDLKGKLELPH